MQGRDRRIIARRLKATAFFLDQPKRSIKQEIMFSNTAIIVEKAAKLINTKKNAPQTRPPCMELNTFGSVTKIRFGPLSGLI